MTIGAKISLILVVATLLSGATAIVGVVVSSAVVERQIDEKYLAVSAYTMETVHRLLLRRYEDIKAVAQDPIFRAAHPSPAQITARLNETAQHFRSYAPYASLSYFTLERIRVADTLGRDLGLRHDLSEYWPEIVAGNDYVLNVSVSESLSESVVHVAHVVHDQGGARVGVVVGRIRIEALWTVLQRPLGLFRIPGALDVDLVDRHGLILYSNHDPKGILEKTSPLNTLVEEARQQGRTSGTALVPDPNGNGNIIAVFAREVAEANYHGSDWALLIAMPEALALAPMTHLRRILLAVSVAIVVLALTLSVALARTITRPITSLIHASIAVGRGRLDTCVDTEAGGEIGDLARIFNRMVRDLAQSDAALRAAATMDRLTGTLNRNGCEQIFTRELERAQRYRSQLALIFIDLDHFKRVNDVHGHERGDRVLEQFPQVIRAQLRSSDILGRWGGEEFIVLTPSTSLEGAAKLAEKLREQVEASQPDALDEVTISAGVAELRDTDTLDSLVRRADAALYAAKSRGRNRVEVSGEA